MRESDMKRRKDPPGYPGDDEVLKAFGESLRDVRIGKGLSLDETDAAFQEAQGKNFHPRLPRALGIIVRQLREEQRMSREQLSEASGLSVRFLTTLERGKCQGATLTEMVRIALGLHHPLTDLLTRIVAKEKELISE